MPFECWQLLLDAILIVLVVVAHRHPRTGDSRHLGMPRVQPLPPISSSLTPWPDSTARGSLVC